MSVIPEPESNLGFFYACKTCRVVAKVKLSVRINTERTRSSARDGVYFNLREFNNNTKEKYV